MKTQPLSALALLGMFSLASAAASAQADTSLVVARQTPRQLAGHLPSPRIEFQGRWGDDDVARFELHSGRAVVVRAEIDYRQQTVKLRSTSSSSGEPAAITVTDLARFQRLLTVSAGRIDAGTRLGEAYFSLLNLLATAPPGRPLSQPLTPPAGASNAHSPAAAARRPRASSR